MIRSKINSTIWRFFVTGSFAEILFSASAVALAQSAIPANNAMNEQCITDFIAPTSSDELLRNVEKALKSNEFSKRCMYTEENLHLIFGGAKIRRTSSNDSIVAGHIYDYSSWRETNDRDAVSISFVVRAKSDGPSKVTIAVNFNNENTLSFDYVVAVFGKDWSPNTALPSYDISFAPPKVRNGNARIFYDRPGKAQVNLFFSSTANLYSIQIFEN